MGTVDDLRGRVRELEDRLALTELMSRYARSLDEHDWRELESLFTDDLYAEHGVVTPPLHSRAEFMAVVRGMETMPRLRYLQHYVSNVEVNVEGDAARVRAFLHAIHWVDGDIGPEVVPAGARYEVDAVRAGGEWRIRRLIVHETWLDPRIEKLYAR